MAAIGGMKFSRVHLLYRKYKRPLILALILSIVIYTVFRPTNSAAKILKRPTDLASKEDDTSLYEDQRRVLQLQKFDPGKQDILKESSEDAALKSLNHFLLEHTNPKDLAKLKLATQASTSFGQQKLKTAQAMFKLVFEIFSQNEPKVDKLDRYSSSKRIYHAGYDTFVEDSGPVFTKEYLQSFLNLNPHELQTMKQSHKAVVSELPEEFPEGIYNGNGIVYVGGGSFNWLVILSIKTLRYLGSELPVEVVIPKVSEYEIDLCSRVFPALGAKCLLLPHILGEDVITKFKFFGYQYKALALLVSSFENVLLLDSDNVPAQNPDYLFQKEPFTTKGLICWPDFWKRATSPFFYKIAGIEIGKERIRFGYNNYGVYEKGIIAEGTENPDSSAPLHDLKGAIPDPSSESGQIILSKKTHSKTLLLALYYNLYGPSHYYPLFSQGSDGEGDKETFLAAAVVLGKPYYQVNKFLNSFGHFDLDRNYEGCGMGQYDPVADYEILQENLKRLPKDRLIKSYSEANISPNTREPKILFVHANFPKLNPIDLRKNHKIFDKNGKRIRLYGEGMPKRVGYDFELVQWQSMFSLVCELQIEIEAFNAIPQKEVCDEISEQLQFLEDSVSTLDT